MRLTDQTSAHDPLNGYVPAGLTLEQANELRRLDPDDYIARSLESMARHVEAMLALKRAGAVTFDYGNNIRKFAFDAGCLDAFEIPGFVPEYIRPLFCEGKGPFRWVALSGDAEDIRKTDDLALELFPGRPDAESLVATGARSNSVSGIAGPHLLARLRRARGDGRGN